MALRHMARFIDLSGMIDLSLNRYFLMLHLLWLSSLASHFGCDNRRPWGFRLVSGVLGRLKGYLDFHYLNVVLFIVASVCANQHLLMGMVCALRSKYFS